MTDDTQGRYCPLCGAWNSSANEKCVACGADLPKDSAGAAGEDTWRIVQDDIVIVPEPPVIPEKVDTPSSRSYQLVRALLIVCCFLVVAAAVGVLVSVRKKPPKPPVKTDMSSESRVTSNAAASENSVTPEAAAATENTVTPEAAAATENSVTSEAASSPVNSMVTEADTATENAAAPEAAPASEKAENLVGSGANEHYYTAPALRLTSFGGKTSGDELIVHSNVRDNYNNKYDAGLGGKQTNVENITEYFIEDQYKYFSFRVVLNYDRRTDYHPDTYVRVYADGTQIYKSESVHNGFKPEDVTLKIDGVDKLKLGICGSGDIRVVDPVLHNDEGYGQYSTMVPYTNKPALDRVPLSHLEYWNGSSAEGGITYISTAIHDESGNTYDAGYAGTHENQDNWVEYDITDCGYTKIIGTIIMNAEPEGVDVVTPVVAIYGGSGQRQLYKSDPVVKGSGTQRFEVSLEDLSQFRLQISGKNNIRLVDCYLSK